LEGKQPSIEEMLNTIEFLKKTLEFYANEKNYKYNPNQINSVSAVHMDEGHQARFALEQTTKITEYNEFLLEKSTEMIKEIDGLDGIDKADKLIQILKEYKANESIQQKEED
jgi:hypothetical protein